VGWVIEQLEPKKQNIQESLKLSQKGQEESRYFDQTVYGSFVLMANITQFELGLPSRAHVLSEGMCLNVGPYLL
jgi:hypothetical protein